MVQKGDQGTLIVEFPNVDVRVASGTTGTQQQPACTAANANTSGCKLAAKMNTMQTNAANQANAVAAPVPANPAPAPNTQQ